MTNTTRTLIITDTTAEIVSARRLTIDEQAKYAEWFRPLGIVTVGERISLDHIRRTDAPKRQADAMALGCDNDAWTITADEESELLATNASRAVIARPVVEDVTVLSHLCPRCHTVCYGDCQA
jgi:hypothetical protein